MSVLDALAIPIAFFLLFLIVGLSLYEMSLFDGIFNSTNASMSNKSQTIYGQYHEMFSFSIDTFNWIIVGVVFLMLLISVLSAAVVYAHPGFFPFMLLLSGGIIVAWYAMNGAIDKILLMPWLATFYDPVTMSWFYVVKNNMYVIISINIGAMILALFMRGGGTQ